jgi:hypothetical protein
MSLNGLVHCDCLATGAAAAPRWPTVFHGPWLAPAPGYETHADDIAAWGRTARAQPMFELVDGQISRGRLQQLLDGLGGRARFPMLYQTIHFPVDDRTSPADSARCLAELDEFADLMRGERMVVLMDADDGRVLSVRADDGLMSYPRLHVPAVLVVVRVDAERRIHGVSAVPGVPLTTTWLDQDAVVRVCDVNGAVVFAAREFEQAEAGPGWWFRDPRGGGGLRRSSPVPGSQDQTGPIRLRAEERPMDVEHAVPGLALLRSLMTAAIRLDHPIYWY